MTAHYGVTLISAANKNAINVVLALWVGDNPAVSQKCQPAGKSKRRHRRCGNVLVWRSSLRRRRTLGNSEFARQICQLRPGLCRGWLGQSVKQKLSRQRQL